jgi:hypothetical protein
MCHRGINNMKAKINLNVKKVGGISVENLENKSELDRNQIKEAGKKMLSDLIIAIKKYYKDKKIEMEIDFEIL